MVPNRCTSTDPAADAKHVAWMAETSARKARFKAIQEAVKAGVPMADAARAAGLPLAASRAA